MIEDYRKIDIKGAADRMHFDEVAVEKLLKMFLDSDLLEKVEKAFNESNIKDAKDSIHSIKGTASSVGAVGLSKLALDIELKIKEVNYLDFELLNVMKQIWGELKSENKK